MIAILGLGLESIRHEMLMLMLIDEVDAMIGELMMAWSGVGVII